VSEITQLAGDEVHDDEVELTVHGGGVGDLVPLGDQTAWSHRLLPQARDPHIGAVPIAEVDLRGAERSSKGEALAIGRPCRSGVNPTEKVSLVKFFPPLPRPKYPGFPTWRCRRRRSSVGENAARRSDPRPPVKFLALPCAVEEKSS